MQYRQKPVILKKLENTRIPEVSLFLRDIANSGVNTATLHNMWVTLYTLFVCLGDSYKCQNVWTDLAKYLAASNASFPMEYLWTDQFEKFSLNSFNRKIL